MLALGTLGLVAGGVIGSVALASPADAATAATPTYTTIHANRTQSTAYDRVVINARVGYGTNSTVHGQTAALQMQVGSAWRTLGYATLSSAGIATWTTAPTSSLTYRVFYTGYLGFKSSSSGPWTITVKPATKAARVLAVAASKTGDWYAYGGAGPSSFDCSGLTQYAFRSVGVSLPHDANAQQRYGYAVAASQARPGDLLIFRSGSYGYHAAIYAGGGYMYDAPAPGQRVGKHKIWSSNVVFRRVV